MNKGLCSGGEAYRKQMKPRWRERTLQMLGQNTHEVFEIFLESPPGREFKIITVILGAFVDGAWGAYGLELHLCDKRIFYGVRHRWKERNAYKVNTETGQITAEFFGDSTPFMTNRQLEQKMYSTYEVLQDAGILA